MIQKILLYTCILISCIAVFLSVRAHKHSPKLAFVRTAVILDNYSGMKEATGIIQQKILGYQSSIDSMTSIYSAKLKQFASQSEQWPKEKRQNQRIYLQELEKQITDYKGEAEIKASKEKETITQGALNQVNSFIEKFARENGFDLILGVTLSGNILYGNDYIDVTDEVLEGLNKNYLK